MLPAAMVVSVCHHIVTNTVFLYILCHQLLHNSQIGIIVVQTLARLLEGVPPIAFHVKSPYLLPKAFVDAASATVAADAPPADNWEWVVAPGTFFSDAVEWKEPMCQVTADSVFELIVSTVQDKLLAKDFAIVVQASHVWVFIWYHHIVGKLFTPQPISKILILFLLPVIIEFNAD
jgi:hypothetical protein